MITSKLQEIDMLNCNQPTIFFSYYIDKDSYEIKPNYHKINLNRQKS